MFEGFNNKCPFKRRYNIWNGRNLLDRVQLKENITNRYFPQYSRYIKQEKIRTEQMLKGI